MSMISVVEIDKTYVNGKGRDNNANKCCLGIQIRGGKISVWGARWRGGKFKAKLSPDIIGEKKGGSNVSS